MYYHNNPDQYYPPNAPYDNSAYYMPNNIYGRYQSPMDSMANPMPAAMPYDPYDVRSNLPEALRIIQEAVSGENEDKVFYAALIDMAPTAEDREIITGIRNNEIKHQEMFKELYFEFTGKRIMPQQSAVPMESMTYCEGLKKALLGEQHAVENYRKILFAMQDRRFINMLTEIITDELRHLGLYNYLYSRNNCNV